MKRSVAKEMEFDDENDKKYKEEKDKADQTGTESYHKESAPALVGVVLLVPFGVHGRGQSVARWRRIGRGVDHLGKTSWVVESVENGRGRVIAWWVFLEEATFDRH